MDVALFQTQSPGQLVGIAGLPGTEYAFVPNPLPPTWNWDDKHWPLLMEAREALAGLSATGKYLPNPELIRGPLQHREARMSSRLEGTITEPQAQALYELDPQAPISDEDSDNAHREVSNYARALRTRREEQQDLPLSLRLIRQLHSILMDGVRGSDRDPGNFRKHQNQIGRPARFVPPPVPHLAGLLDNLEKYLHAECPLDPLVKAFIVHYQFETIHPFNDGNGRIGRLLLAICIAEWCNMSNQWLFMSEYFDRHRDEYIDHLFAISTAARWTEWIEFCLRGVVEQATSTAERCDRLIELNRDFHDRVKTLGGSVRLSGMVDSLFEYPVITVAGYARRHEVTYPTARSDLRKLEEVGMLNRLEGAKMIAYYCDPILEITYAD